MAFPTQSIDFAQASNEYAYAADSASLSVTGNFTAEAWVNLTTIGAGQEFYVVSKWVGSGNQRSYIFRITDANTIQFLVSADGSTNDTLGVSWTPSTGTWYHVAVSWTAASSTAKFFIDGSQQGTDQVGSRTAIFNGSADCNVGALESTAIANGRVVLARIWAEARTGTQINDNKCSTLGATTNLSAEWTFDNVYTDNSGNSNTLTGVNTPTFAANIPATCAVTGPANLKTLDTNVKANIKTFDTNTLANMKTYNTNA